MNDHLDDIKRHVKPNSRFTAEELLGALNTWHSDASHAATQRNTDADKTLFGIMLRDKDYARMCLVIDSFPAVASGLKHSQSVAKLPIQEPDYDTDDFLVTKEWLDLIKPADGYTNGQQYLISRFEIAPGVTISRAVANNLSGCKLYFSGRRSTVKLTLPAPVSQSVLADRFKRSVERLKQFGVQESEIFHPQYESV